MIYRQNHSHYIHNILSLHLIYVRLGWQLAYYECALRAHRRRCRRTFGQIVSLNYSLCDAQHRRMLSIISVDFPVSMLSWDTITRSGDNCVWLHERDSISFGGDFAVILVFILRGRFACANSMHKIEWN